MKMTGREVAIMFYGGSHMRNLNDEHSDEDLKYFVLPTREDLYTSTVFTDFKANDDIDVDIQDIRRFDNLFYKANPSYLDLLFSPEIETFGYQQIDDILAMKDSIACMNLPYLFSATMGMFNRNVGDLQRRTSPKVAEMIDNYHYNTKKAMLSIHFARFLVDFEKTEFTQYRKAIWYEGKERDFMMDIKRGKVDWSEMQEMLKAAERQMKLTEQSYKEQPFNTETHQKLQELLRDLVFSTL